MAAPKAYFVRMKVVKIQKKNIFHTVSNCHTCHPRTECGDPADSRRYPHLRISYAENRPGCASDVVFPRHFTHLRGIISKVKTFFFPVAFSFFLFSSLPFLLRVPYT